MTLNLQYKKHVAYKAVKTFYTHTQRHLLNQVGQTRRDINHNIQNCNNITICSSTAATQQKNITKLQTIQNIA